MNTSFVRSVLFLFAPAALHSQLFTMSSAAKDDRPAAWHDEAKTRWAELEIPREGKTGFTLLSPLETGLQFTNQLDEWSSAANRVLENGGGLAMGDYDGDSRLDIFLCGLAGRHALFRNLGGWRFENVTARAGITCTNSARGAVFADINGDGMLDLLISTLAEGVLCLTNSGTGRFDDATSAAGTRSPFGAMTLACADVDGNGTLDLYVANYRTNDIRDQAQVEVRRVGGKLEVAPWLRDRILLTPEGLLEFGDPDILYLNDGAGRFRPVSWTGGTFRDESGQPIEAPPRDWGLAAAFRDVNGDGHPDLYVCNDYWTPDRLWINDGKGGFRAADRPALRHTSENSMGVDFADVDQDGRLDFFVADMLSRSPARRKQQALAQTRMPAAPGEIFNRPQIMRNMLFWNQGDGTFREIGWFAGIAASDWSWQPFFIDVDLDGFDDLIIPAGHSRDVQDLDATERIQSLQHAWPADMDRSARQAAFTREMMEHARYYPPLLMPIVTFRNLGDLRFAEMTERWGTDQPGVHQGTAFGDLDGDGDLDFVVNNLNGACGVYRNESIAPRLAVRLKGASPNTQAVGATVTLLNGAVPRQQREVVSGGRYLSGCDTLVVFAAAEDRKAMALEIRWRNGRRLRINQVQANRIYEVAE